MALRRKPRVAIVHSAKSKYTTAGVDLAVYLGVCLQLGGMEQSQDTINITACGKMLLVSECILTEPCAPRMTDRRRILNTFINDFKFTA